MEIFINILVYTLVVFLLSSCSPAEEVEEEEQANVLDYECVHVIEESVSCGWPIYLRDGRRIDNEMDLALYRITNALDG